jgi:hypothetical protein
MLEKDGEDGCADHVKQEEILQGKEERNILHTVREKRANWSAHILCMNCLLKHVTEEKI